MLLPSVPAGTNPFTVYKSALQARMHATPSSGFGVRLAVLFGLCSLLIVLSGAYWVTLNCESRANGQQSPTWLFRRIDRRRGGYIITNGKLVLVSLSTVSRAILLAYLIGTYKLYVLHGQEHRISTLWASLPFFTQSWLITWSALQASLLASDAATTQPVFSARTANILFVGFGTFGGAAVLGCVILAEVIEREVLRKVGNVVAKLTTFEEAWTPDSNIVGPLLALKPSFEELAHDADNAHRIQLGIYAVFITVPVVIIAVNIAALRLAKVIDAQVRYNLQLIRPSTAFSSRPPQVNRISGFIREIRFAPVKRSDLVERGEQARGTGEWERLRNILMLRKAQKELVITSWILIAMLSSTLAFIIYALHLLVNRQLVPSNWAATETVLLFIPWVYSVPMNLILIALLYLLWDSRSLRPRLARGNSTRHSPPNDGVHVTIDRSVHVESGSSVHINLHDADKAGDADEEKGVRFSASVHLPLARPCSPTTRSSDEPTH
ncbi:hypothetical protein JCM10296v2_007570 [Rhodotorula toruloides]